jgi:purine-nucleoside phosphorylase
MPDFTNLRSRLAESAAYLETELGPAPRLAVVLGSGLSQAGESWNRSAELPYSRIPHFPQVSTAGHPGNLWRIESDRTSFAALAGRCHFYEGFSLSEVVFAVRALSFWGVEVFLLTNAAGAISPILKSGQFMLVRDHINLMPGSPLRGQDCAELGAPFVDLSEAYDEGLRRTASESGLELGLDLAEGVYLAVPGPSFETPAEIRMFRSWGADAVGMSTVPEVIALQQLGRRILALSCLTNLAAGRSTSRLSHLEVLEVTRGMAGSLGELILRIAEKCSPRGC